MEVLSAEVIIHTISRPYTASNWSWRFLSGSLTNFHSHVPHRICDGQRMCRASRRQIFSTFTFCSLRIWFVFGGNPWPTNERADVKKCWMLVCRKIMLCARVSSFVLVLTLYWGIVSGAHCVQVIQNTQFKVKYIHFVNQIVTQHRFKGSEIFVKQEELHKNFAEFDSCLL